MVKQHLLEEKKDDRKAHHKFPVPGVVVLVIVSVFLLYVVIQPLKGQCTATGCQPCINDYSELPVTAVCTCPLQPLNLTLTDVDSNVATVCSIDSDQWYGLPFCTLSSALGDCSVTVKVMVNTSSKNGKALVHLMPGECAD